MNVYVVPAVPALVTMLYIVIVLADDEVMHDADDASPVTVHELLCTLKSDGKVSTNL